MPGFDTHSQHGNSTILPLSSLNSRSNHCLVRSGLTLVLFISSLLNYHNYLLWHFKHSALPAFEARRKGTMSGLCTLWQVGHSTFPLNSLTSPQPLSGSEGVLKFVFAAGYGMDIGWSLLKSGPAITDSACESKASLLPTSYSFSAI